MNFLQGITRVRIQLYSIIDRWSIPFHQVLLINDLILDFLSVYTNACANSSDDISV
jgi:hypothetical protein